MDQRIATLYARLVQQMYHYERLLDYPHAAYEANKYLTRADRTALELSHLTGFHDDCLK